MTHHGLVFRVLAVALLALTAIASHGQHLGRSVGKTVTIGEESIRIMEPDGYHDVTEISEAVLNSAAGTPSANRLLAVLMSRDVIDKLLRGDALPTAQRTFTLQTLRSFEQRKITAVDFSQAALVLKTQHEELMRRMQPQIRERTESMQRSLRNGLQDPTVGIRLGESVPVRIFNEAPATISMTSLQKGEFTAGDRSERLTMAIVYTLARVKNKILFLYVAAPYRTASDLDWAEQSALEWSQSILAAN